MPGHAPLVTQNGYRPCHYVARVPVNMPSNPRVLIVDDDDATTKTFARILTLEGFDVRTADSAESGLREIETGHPDAVILDLRMPFINGLGLLYRLRAGEPGRQTPVAIVTGDQCIDDAVIRELHDLGAEVRFKPLWIDDLVDVARSLVGSRIS
jgi:DNA-binding response OmpR family regulator